MAELWPFPDRTPSLSFQFKFSILSEVSHNQNICNFQTKTFPWLKRQVLALANKCLWSVGIQLMGGEAHHTHFPYSLLQFFSSPPIPTVTTLTSCFLPGLAATKCPKNKLPDLSWAQFCHHCSVISCLFVQLHLASSVKSVGQSVGRVEEQSEIFDTEEEGHARRGGEMRVRYCMTPEIPHSPAKLLQCTNLFTLQLQGRPKGMTF